MRGAAIRFGSCVTQPSHRAMDDGPRMNRMVRRYVSRRDAPEADEQRCRARRVASLSDVIRLCAPDRLPIRDGAMLHLKGL